MKTTPDGWGLYRRTGLSEMIAWTPGHDMTGVSVSDADLEAGSPKAGDMIARNPKNPADRWLVAAKYFRDNLEPVPSDDVPPVDLPARCVLSVDGWHAIADPDRDIDIGFVKVACGAFVANASKMDTRTPTCPACRNVVRGWVRRDVVPPFGARQDDVMKIDFTGMTAAQVVEAFDRAIRERDLKGGGA